MIQTECSWKVNYFNLIQLWREERTLQAAYMTTKSNYTLKVFIFIFSDSAKVFRPETIRIGSAWEEVYLNSLVQNVLQHLPYKHKTKTKTQKYLKAGK